MCILYNYTHMYKINKLVYIQLLQLLSSVPREAGHRESWAHSGAGDAVPVHPVDSGVASRTLSQVLWLGAEGGRKHRQNVIKLAVVKFG